MGTHLSIYLRRDNRKDGATKTIQAGSRLPAKDTREKSKWVLKKKQQRIPRRHRHPPNSPKSAPWLLPFFRYHGLSDPPAHFSHVFFYGFTCSLSFQNPKERTESFRMAYVSKLNSSWALGVFYTYFYNHAHCLRLEKLLYLELSRSSNGFFKYFWIQVAISEAKRTLRNRFGSEKVTNP